jgi:FkbM family methyltransferase
VYMQLFEKFYGVKPIGIIHVGAHLAEEYTDYQRFMISPGTSCIWIEPQPEKVVFLRELFAKKPQHKVIEALAWSEDARDITLNITNFSPASSVFDLRPSRDFYPSIEVSSQIKLSTSRLETILDVEDKFDFLVLDVQGAELEVLKGLGRRLAEINWIFTEVSRKNDLYEGGVLYLELKQYLENNGFKQKFVEWDRKTYSKQGDALFIRNEVWNQSPLLGAQRLILWIYRRIYQRIPTRLLPSLVRLKRIVRKNIYFLTRSR